MQVTVRPKIDLYVYAGNFQSFPRRPKTDKTVVDANSTIVHVFRYHIAPGMAAVDRAVAPFEMRLYRDESECNAWCRAAKGLLGVFARAVAESQERENRGEQPE